jgi:hypothetical protein
VLAVELNCQQEEVGVARGFLFLMDIGFGRVLVACGFAQVICLLQAGAGLPSALRQ